MEATQSIERPLKRQQRTVGAIVKIPLENGFHTYARILEEASLAFYDARTKDELLPLEITRKRILFIISVSDRVITKGYWKKISKKIPLEEHLQTLPPTFIQDALNPDKFEIIEGDELFPRSATREECLGLERTSVWDYNHVEKRLNDHYANRPNAYVDAMRQLRPYSELVKEPDFKQKYGFE